MLSPSFAVRTCRTRCGARPFVVVQRRGGHDHHHHNDLSHLERPAVTPENFFSSVGHRTFKGRPELQADYLKQHFGHYENKEYHLETNWVHQFVNSKTVLKCLAEINGTEFHHPLKADTLVQVYKEQLSNFESVTASALEREGISKAIITKLHEIYTTRAFVDKWEVEEAIKRFSFLGGAEANYRVTNSPHNKWPMWKSIVPVPFLRSWMVNSEYLSTEQTLGRVVRSNDEAAEVNVRQFRGIIAFINAVKRGLTDEERQKVRAILVQGRNPIRVSDQSRAEIDRIIGDISTLSQTDPLAAKKKLGKTYLRYRRDIPEKTYFRQRAIGVVPKTAMQVFEEAPHDDEPEVVLQEGVHYFTSEADRLAAVEQVNKNALNWVNDQHATAQASGNDKQKGFWQKFKKAAETVMSPQIQGDLEIMGLLRGSNLTPRQQDEILSIFRNDSDRADDAVLLDAVNPHPVSQRLFGHRIRSLCQERTEYVKNFYEGADTTWVKESNWEKGTEDTLENPVFNAPPLVYTDFNTAMDEILHMKLIRLATDYYGLDLNSDIGLMTFDRLVHTYDISPGEETLDRTHPSPPDLHTYEELPIIKYDGWEECDDDPPEEHDEFFDSPALIEGEINRWLEQVSRVTGTKFLPIKELASGKALSELQVRTLRSILNANNKDADKIHKMKKVWRVAGLPDKELEMLFEEQEEILLAAGGGH